MQSEFTVGEAAKILGATERNIRYWSGPGEVVEPAIANPRRKRMPKLFSLGNLFQLAITKVLAERGTDLKYIRRAVQVSIARGNPRNGIVEFMIFRPSKGWRLSADMMTAQDNVLPQKVVDNLVKAASTEEEIIVLNLSKIKQQVLGSL